MAGRGRGVGLFLLLLALYAATASGTVGPRLSDGRTMFAVTAALVDRHALDVRPAALGVPGRAGLAYSKFGLGQSLVAVPLYLAGALVAARLPPASRLQALMMACSFLDAILLALLCALLPALAVRMGLATPGTAPWLGLLAGLTTPLWPYAQIFFSEPLIALCLVLALLALWPAAPAPNRRTAPLLGCGAALGLAVLTRLDSLIYVPIVALAAALLHGCPVSSPVDPHERQGEGALPVAPLAHAGAPVPATAAAIYPSPPASAPAPFAPRPAEGAARRLAAAGLVLLPVIVAVAAIAWYNGVRFGSPLESGYGRGAQGEAVDVAFHRSLGYLGEGLWDLLASPGKGIVVYAPVVLLVPWGAWTLWRGGRRAPVAVLLALCAADWLAHANLLIRWLGGWAWGPRFLVPVLPLLVVLAGGVLHQTYAGRAPRRPRGIGLRRLAVAILALAGLLVQLPAVAADYHPYLEQLSGRYSRYAGDPAAPYRAEDAYVPSVALSPIVGQWRFVLDAATWRDQPDWGRRSVAAVSGARAAGPHYAAPRPDTWWALLASEGVPWPAWLWPLGLLALVGSGGLCLVLRPAVNAPPSAGRP